MNRILVLLVASFALCHATDFPNLNYLGAGYDIYKGNPHATDAQGLVSGFRSSIYNLQEGGAPVAGISWIVPTGVQAFKLSSCSYDSTTTDVKGERSYHDSLAVSVSVEAGFPAGSFSASTDYKRVSNEAYQDHKIEVHTVAECTAYRANIETFSPPKLSTNFNNAISSLIQFPTNNLLARQIVTEFGTHVVTTVTMGAKLVKQDIFTQNAYQTLLSQSIDVKTAAKLSWGGYSGAFSANTATESEIQKKYDGSRSDTKVSIIGSQPTFSASTPNQWQINADTTPFPHAYTLKPLDEFVSVMNFPSFNQSSVDAARAVLQQVISTWCSTAGGISCDGEKSDVVSVYHTVTVAYGNSDVQVNCPRGAILSVGMGSRQPVSGGAANNPNYMIESATSGRCQAKGENIECNALCTEQWTAADFNYAIAKNDDDEAYATCPDGYIVASCATSFQNPADFSYHQHATPINGNTCWCWGYGPFTCQATCINASKVVGYMQASNGANGGQEFFVACPNGKKLLGCGIDVTHDNGDGNFIRVAPASDNSCKCWTKSGGTCFAQCADF